MSEYDNRGQVALWKNESDNEKAPNAKGTVIAHRRIEEGEMVEIALWKNQSENPNAPVMKGKIGDRKKKEQQQPEPPPQEPFNDDIPF